MMGISHRLLCLLICLQLAQADITISWGFDISDASRTVYVGETVKWITDQNDGEHTVTSSDAEKIFDSGFMMAGDEFEFTFNEAGTYAYKCLPHPTRMTGIITVIGYDSPVQGACCTNAGSCISVGGPSSCNGVFMGINTTCSADTCQLDLQPFVDPLPIPVVAQARSGRAGYEAEYLMRMTEFKQKLHRDLPPTTVWGYNGMFPGPTIETWTNQPVTVTWINDLRDLETRQLRKNHYLNVDECLMGPDYLGSKPYTVPHLHGGEAPFRFDGHPDFQFGPGNADTYVYPNDQDATMIWYHDHGLGITRLNVYMGLAGLWLIRDEVETNLQLPSGRYEIPLVIMDRDFTLDGQLKYPSQWQGMFTAPFILVNGMVWPYHEVERKAYRLRLLNGCNSRILTLRLSRGRFWIIGGDHGFLPKRRRRLEVTLAPAERLDVIVDFSNIDAGKQVNLWNYYDENEGFGQRQRVLQFRVQDGEAAPQYKPPMRPRPFWNLRKKEAEAVQEREFVLEVLPDMCTSTKFTINRKGWEDITEIVERGSIEIWSFINPDPSHHHPMHMHLVQFLVLDRTPLRRLEGGSYEPAGEPEKPDKIESGYKDTVNVRPLEKVRVIMKFPKNVGRFAYHCHTLEHEDHDMMRQFWVTHKPQDCNNNGICEDKEDCYSCPSDCGINVGSVCGNGLCEAGDGENCGNCPQDCAGTPGGICCGLGDVEYGGQSYGMTSVGCIAGVCQDGQDYFCRIKPQPRACCGDSACWGGETPANCPADCPQGTGL